MSPERTFGERGSYRFDLMVPGVGRIRRKSGARTVREHARRVALLEKLRDDKARLDLLQAFHEGRIRMAELIDADRRNHLPAIVAEVYLGRPLWAAVQQALDAARAAPATIATYRVSWRALEASGELSPDAKVSDLSKVDWRDLEARWGRSGASWNHLRRAVSRTLTLILGSRWHPVRTQILADFPVRHEQERVPDLSPEEYARRLQEPDFSTAEVIAHLERL